MVTMCTTLHSARTVCVSLDIIHRLDLAMEMQFVLLELEKRTCLLPSSLAVRDCLQAFPSCNGRHQVSHPCETATGKERGTRPGMLALLQQLQPVMSWHLSVQTELDSSFKPASLRAETGTASESLPMDGATVLSLYGPYSDVLLLAFISSAYIVTCRNRHSF
jgi:hypothetical protein